jgi:DNA-binding protein HU-beta
MARTPNVKAVLDDIVDIGQAQRDKASAALEEALAAGKRGTEQLTAIVRREVERQLRALGLRPARPAKKTSAKQAVAKQTATKKAAAKKTVNKTATTVAKKTGAKKTAAKKTAKKVAKKTSAKKTGAKKSSASRSAR